MNKKIAVIFGGCSSEYDVSLQSSYSVLSNIDNVRVGDSATIIGKAENSEITVYEVAEKTYTITNEILSRLGTRLERVITILS